MVNETRNTHNAAESTHSSHLKSAKAHTDRGTPNAQLVYEQQSQQSTEVAMTLMARRGVHKEGIARVVLSVSLLLLTAARAFLVPASPLLLEQKHEHKHVTYRHKLQHQPTTSSRRATRVRRSACSTRCSSGSSPPEGLDQHQHQQQGGAAGAGGGISSAATLLSVNADAVTRTEALTRFFAASLTAFSTTTAVAGAVAGAAAPEAKAPLSPANGLGVVDDLLADCPSVR